MNLMPGGNAPVASQTLTVRVLSGASVDVSAFRLYASGKVRGDTDMVFMVNRLRMIAPSVCLGRE
ncbi:hypothetical protein AU253_07625 [Yersinia pestis]|nr:hypothetical protein AU254_06510 [Yersinia pestis]KYP02205.1 hypothetical protein AU253_07625 [Yersinia pestis]